MKQRPELFSNFGWPDYLFYLQKLPGPPPSYEMVGVKITVSNYGQSKSYFWHFFSCWFFIYFSDNSKCFHRNGFEMYILIIIYTVCFDEDFKFWDFLVLFRFPQMRPRVIHYYRFQCCCPVFRINWLFQNEMHCSW